MECYVDQSTLLILVHIRIFAFVGVAYVLCYSRAPAQTAYRGSDVFSDVTWTSALRGVNPSEAGLKTRLTGDNIAFGPECAEEVVAGWLASPRHCENIMDSRFQDIGVGLATGPGRGRIYWVQTFGAPRFGERR